MGGELGFTVIRIPGMFELLELLLENVPNGLLI